MPVTPQKVSRHHRNASWSTCPDVTMFFPCSTEIVQTLCGLTTAGTQSWTIWQSKRRKTQQNYKNAGKYPNIQTTPQTTQSQCVLSQLCDSRQTCTPEWATFQNRHPWPQLYLQYELFICLYILRKDRSPYMKSAMIHMVHKQHLLWLWLSRPKNQR